MILTTTGVRYAEHENLNSYRNYPFAEAATLKDTDGQPLSTDIIVDAILYPIVASPGIPSLRRLDFAPGNAAALVVVVSGTEEIELSGNVVGGAVELYDPFGRHAGSLVCGPGWEREAGAGRTREFQSLPFAASVCCPVVYKGVVSLADEGRTWRTTRKNLVLQGDGIIEPVLSKTELGYELRFDAQYNQNAKPRQIINQVQFAVVGKALFDLYSDMALVDDGVVELYTSALDREDICWQAHKEDTVATVVDTCENESEGCVVPLVPEKRTKVLVCPSDIGNISLVADDVVNYKNPLKITPVEGSMRQLRPQITADMGRNEAFEEAQKLLARPVVVGNGIKISMPGLSNGK